MAAAVPTSGRPRRPSSSPAAPAVLRVPIGKVSHDSGTPALAMPGRIGRKWARAAMPEKALAATATRVTTRTAVPMRMPPLAGDADGLPDRLRPVERGQHEVGDVGPRDQEAAPEVPPQGRPVGAGPRPVGQPRGPHRGPV